MTIILRKSHQGWTATFNGSGDMPNGVALPLPFTNGASAEMVRADLRSRFATATLITKACSR